MKTPNKPTRQIGFRPSYMNEDEIVMNAPENINTTDTQDPIVSDLRQKIAELTIEMTRKKFARLSQKTKLKRLLDYNLLVVIETKIEKIL